MNALKCSAMMLLGTCLILAFIGCGCKDNEVAKPKITLSVTDCPVDAIDIEASTKLVGRHPNRVVTVTVLVTCYDDPVNDAEVKVTWWWGSFESKITTGPDGKGTSERKKVWENPKGETVKLTIIGSNGDEKEVKIVVK